MKTVKGLFHKSTLGEGFWECLDTADNRKKLKEARVLYYTTYFMNDLGERISRLRFENWQYNKLESYLKTL